MENTYGFTDKGEWNDHTFAAWLRENGWDGRHDTVGDWVRYYNENDEQIALALYSNTIPLWKKVFIKESL